MSQKMRNQDDDGKLSALKDDKDVITPAEEYKNEEDNPDTGHMTLSFTTAKWLYEICSGVSSPLSTLQLSEAVLSVICSSHHDEAKMESSLFELFGDGEQSIEVLFGIVSNAANIRKVTREQLQSVAENKGDSSSSKLPAQTAAAPTTDSSNQPLEEADNGSTKGSLLKQQRTRPVVECVREDANPVETNEARTDDDTAPASPDVILH